LAAPDADEARRSRCRCLSVARGLVVGKFCPLHLGHERLIDFAATRCQQLLVIGWSQPGFAATAPRAASAGCVRVSRRRRWRCWMRDWRHCARSMVACAHAAAGQ
jgi:nicotinamide mononucleotide adenylyltransferase